MTTIILLTHYQLGQSFLICAQHFFGQEINGLYCVPVDKDDDPDERQAYVQSLIDKNIDGSGTLILSDIFGATPSNIALRLTLPNKVAAISGLNLPMLIRAINYREHPLDVLLEKVKQAAHEGVIETFEK